MEVCYIMMGLRSDGDCNAQWSPMGAAMLCDLWWGLEPRLLTVLFFGERGEGCSLGASGGLFLPPGNRGEVLACVHACVCVCVYGEGKVSLCNEIFQKFLSGFPDWLEERESISRTLSSPLPPYRECLTCLVSLQLPKRGHSCQQLMRMWMSANWKHLPEILKTSPEKQSRKNPQIPNPWTLELERT